MSDLQKLSKISFINLAGSSSSPMC